MENNENIQKAAEEITEATTSGKESGQILMVAGISYLAGIASRYLVTAVVGGTKALIHKVARVREEAKNKKPADETSEGSTTNEPTQN